MSSSPRWKHRPPGSNWGDFGPDDQCGRLNLLTPEKVLQGMQEVRTGQTFNLSLPLDYPGASVLNPRRSAPVLRPTVRNGKPNMNYQLWCDDPLCTDVISDDLVIMHLQYSTQWDSLAHVGSMFDANGDGVPEAVYYNGFRAGTDVVGPSSGSGAGIFGFPEIARESTSSAKALGIEKMSERCVQGRAVIRLAVANHRSRWADFEQLLAALPVVIADARQHAHCALHQRSLGSPAHSSGVRARHATPRPEPCRAADAGRYGRHGCRDPQRPSAELLHHNGDMAHRCAGKRQGAPASRHRHLAPCSR